MTWQVGAFGLLGLALLAGFAWYERRRPDARIVALVGTLAAFAALGRIAFAAVPNVKPTTDIVLISGYALGAGPGFAVGALAGLTSNFFFGQGPWTPWQMAAWGACGVIGAGLAWATSPRMRSRWSLRRPGSDDAGSDAVGRLGRGGLGRGGLGGRRPTPDRALAAGPGLPGRRVRFHGRAGRGGLGHLQRPQPGAAGDLRGQGPWL